MADFLVMAANSNAVLTRRGRKRHELALPAARNAVK